MATHLVLQGLLDPVVCLERKSRAAEELSTMGSTGSSYWTSSASSCSQMPFGLVKPSADYRFDVAGRTSGVAYSTSLDEESYHDWIVVIIGCGTTVGFAAIVGSWPSYGCASTAGDDLAYSIPVDRTNFVALGRGSKSFWPGLEFVGCLGSTRSDFWSLNCFSRP